MNPPCNSPPTHTRMNERHVLYNAETQFLKVKNPSSQECGGNQKNRCTPLKLGSKNQAKKVAVEWERGRSVSSKFQGKSYGPRIYGIMWFLWSNFRMGVFDGLTRFVVP